MKTIKKIFASILSMLSATSAMTVSADVINDEIDMNKTNDDNIEREAETASATIMDDENVDFDESAQPAAEYTENEITEVAANAKNYAVKTVRTNIASDDYYIVGDANVDYQLNVRDAACVARALAKSKTKTLPEAADYTQDDIINVRDAAGIARYCAESYSSDMPLTTVPITQPAVTTTTTVADEIVVTNSIAADDATTTTTYVSHDRPLVSCTCTTDENTVTCPNCGIPYICSCEARPEAHKLAETTATETTTTTVTTQTTEETETNSVTSTNQNIIETEVTTEVSINELPVETVTTTTTVTTVTEAPVTTVSETVTTTVSDNVVTASIDDYYIVYRIKPIYEMHNISHGEDVDRTIMYYEWATTTDSEDKCGDYWDRNVFHPWHIEQFGYFCQGFGTQNRIIGFSYEFYCANPWDNALKAKPDSSLAIYSAKEFSKIVDRDIPEYFESTKCIDGNGVIHDMYDEFFHADGDNLPTPDKTNVLDYYDVFISSPVIYYNNIDRSTGELKS